MRLPKYRATLLGVALPASLVLSKVSLASVSCPACNSHCCPGAADACMPQASTLSQAWDDPRRASAMLVTKWTSNPAMGRCSGTLVNNTSQDLLIVSAAHCLDRNGDNVLSPGEVSEFQSQTVVYYGYGSFDSVGGRA